MRLAKLIALLAGFGAAVAMTSANAADYLIGTNNGKNNSLASEVVQAGGVLKKTFSFGLAIASSDDPAFADNLYDISSVQFVVEDVGFDVEYPTLEGGEQMSILAGEITYPPNSTNDDFLFNLQWGHNYVGAQEAWSNGFRGQGVRVAILDGGYDTDHPDLAPNVNLALSADFTGQGLEFTCPSTFSHGTHVAGTVAAADNGIGSIGVAPEAELVLLKVLSENASCSGSGTFADVIEGIVYAADVGADVMNMSLGATIARQGAGGANADISALQNAVNKAITYAHNSGTTVIVSGGNDAQDLDGGDRGAVRFNTGMSHAVGISSLAPYNWASVPEQDITLSYFSNYGTSMIDFGAPGGSVQLGLDELNAGVPFSFCVVIGIARPCYVFDLVLSSSAYGGWSWAQGTSMASPHAAGVAALIISETGDSRPAQVIREMRRRAVDAGKPGRDDDYGHGIANSGL